ncbi:hypothetical protein SDRG_09182 [Saprolegnia diclina VS20]|uniref:Uncharacterized protein n=1 Tax=Saprolegnia diclina (strain VS20) TaxID=1156394 RepID=T0RLK6_SAPDV|nr:hypothetical protein SDRG_09182 [Saprolegnia diclina VS20]EQC33198.1 hypothetical protein SDRG_09182 [Saprolegnia diclina VS20]|eukprot:XP_008613321.1 hypothetical protein SDRG_09182 [Saprolegnia diclina VS20]
MVASFAIVQQYLPVILANLPYEWRGTTFANSALLGREAFAANIEALISAKHAAKDATITEAELTATGNAEDYLRVSSNISTLLEFVLGAQVGLPTAQVFTFGSTTMPIISVLLAAKLPVVLYVDESATTPFTQEQIDALKLLNTNLTVRAGRPVADASVVVLSLQATPTAVAHADGIVTPNSVLYIHNTAKIAPADVLVVRKRLATPLTTPVCEAYLQAIANVKVTADQDRSSPEELNAFYAHLQTMSGTDAKADAQPVVFTAGLPSVCTLWLALLQSGGADVLMASTAYGGSSQLTDIFTSRAPTLFSKSTFDITGKNEISSSIKAALDALSPKNKTTVLFVEIPTNPDMKVPDMATLATHLTSYQTRTGKDVLLLVDTTFAPACEVMRKMSDVAPGLTTMVFISMSKSVSRGFTTAGTIIANSASAKSVALLEKVRWTGALLDTTAKHDQLYRLTSNHVGVEARNRKAYEVTNAVGNALVQAVKTHAKGYVMDLAFVTPAQAAAGFTTSTFSFNLPPLPTATAEENIALAQRFVDLLTAHKNHFKPCVSFGQDNGLVYCTVPATSTQGAIKAEDKAKQLVGGVELCRLSFPPNADVPVVIAVIEDAIKTIYA